jgi:hypothetical protein
VETKWRDPRSGLGWILNRAGVQLASDTERFSPQPPSAGRVTYDLRSGPAPSRVEFDNDEPSRCEDPSEEAHQWVAVRSTQYAQILTLDDIELKLWTSRPTNRELKVVVPRGGGNRHALAVPDSCHAVAVEQNAIGPSRAKPSS